MEDTTSKELQKWLDDGLQWTDIFARILSSMPENERTRGRFFGKVIELCDIRIEDLSMIGGWNHWNGEGFDDSRLNQMLKDKIRAKAATKASDE